MRPGTPDGVPGRVVSSCKELMSLGYRVVDQS